SPYACGVVAAGNTPSLSKVFFTFESLSAAFSAAFKVVTTEGGVLAGDTTPYQVGLFKSGRPASVYVGTSGRSLRRASDWTANAQNFPSLTCDRAELTLSNTASIWPE